MSKFTVSETKTSNAQLTELVQLWELGVCASFRKEDYLK